MKSFIEESANYLYKKYGDKVSDIEIIIPSRRASLFFSRALAHELEGRPLWQPRFRAVGEVFTELSGLMLADRLKLITILYKVYSRYHKEDFDKFYYWGDMLLNDFEAIDNYMADATRLFTNSGDLSDVDERFFFIEESDRKEIARFWSSFSMARESEEKSIFSNVWINLIKIYNDFREALRSEGIAYSGMACRDVAEGLLSGDIKLDKNKKYAIVGFNALSTTEKILFTNMKEKLGADFLWDYDDFYFRSEHNEAGYFLKKNIKLLGKNNIVKCDNYSKKKDITIVKSPSKSLEAKYVWQFLTKCQAQAEKEGRTLGAETAIILTDESLLMPVLNAIPSFIKHVNVTAGYELRLTLAYNLIESLVNLQTIGGEEFHYKDVIKLLNNPLICKVLDDTEISASHKCTNDDTLYYQADYFSNYTFLSKVFTKKRGWSDICNYMLFIVNKIISLTINHEGEACANAETNESLYRVLKAIKALNDLIATLDIEMSDYIFYSLLKKHLKKERISFEGEPLLGIQVMGILESRTLDFDNVLILSVEEDNFPSKSMGASYIPPSLRIGFGLPGAREHQAIYAYYFYRLLQRANTIDVSYVSSGDEVSSGEPTRYIHQLKYASDHAVKEINLSVELMINNSGVKGKAKDAQTKKYFNTLAQKKVKLSPSSFYNYVRCPLKFYYSKIQGLRKEETDRTIELDAAKQGTLLHNSLEHIYTKLIGKNHDDVVKELAALKDSDIVLIVENTLKDFIPNMPETMLSDRDLAIKTTSRYIRNVVNYDLSRKDDFTVTALEQKIEGTISGVAFGGTIDRVDTLASGKCMIIDYKSSSKDKVKSLDEVFSRDTKKSTLPFMQSLIYCKMYADKYNVDCIPNIFYVREMSADKGQNAIHIGNEPVTSFNATKDEFSSAIEACLNEMRDMELNFEPRNDEIACSYCDFKELCLK